jgi:hypothetical protein
MRGLAQKGVPEIAPWLSETPRAECQCEQCLKIGQLQAEVNAVLDAWREVRREYPALRLRIFFSLGNDDSERTRHCLETLPPEVIIEKVYGVQKPYLEAAARGRTVISYSGQNLTRLHGAGARRFADRFRSRIERGFNDKLAGVLSISYFYSARAPQYHPRVHGYNMNAVAEWSWNVNGRTLRDFAVAWATREGYPDPVKFADWVETMEPVEAPIVTYYRDKHFFHHETADFFRQGKPRAYLSDEQITYGLIACERALAIADGFTNPEPAAETRYIAVLLRAHRRLNALSAAVSGDIKSEEGRKKVLAALEAYRATVRTTGPSLDPLMDLLTIEPQSFAGTIKQKHAEGWKKTEQDVAAAIGELLRQ